MKNVDKVIKETEELIKKENKMKLTDKTIKVTTIIKSILIVLAIIMAFVSGWLSNTEFTNARNAEVKASAKALVQDLKSSK